MGRTITAQSTVDPEENILRQVLGFRSVSGEPVADVKDAPGMATHKFLPGRPVALEALLDQLGILLQRIISLITCCGARRVCESASLSKAVWQSISACQLWNVKCSRNVPRGIGSRLPTVISGILLSKFRRDKGINEVGGLWLQIDVRFSQRSCSTCWRKLKSRDQRWRRIEPQLLKCL